MDSGISVGSSVSVGSSISVFGGVFAFLCLRQLSQAEHPVQEKGKGPVSWSLEAPDSRNVEGSVPRNLAHKCTTSATAMLIQEVRWGCSRAAGHIQRWPCNRLLWGESRTNGGGPRRQFAWKTHPTSFSLCRLWFEED